MQSRTRIRGCGRCDQLYEDTIVLRMVILKVMYENNIDVFVNPEQTTPPYKLGGPGEPEINDRPTISCCTGFTALLGGPEMEVPAGYTEIVYDQTYALTPDKKNYIEVTGQVESRLPHPMPISMMFWGGPGTDSSVIRAGSAYESATHHRVPPPEFGPLPGKESNWTAYQPRVRKLRMEHSRNLHNSCNSEQVNYPFLYFGIIFPHFAVDHTKLGRGKTLFVVRPRPVSSAVQYQ